jgi:hypothetical protein
MVPRLSEREILHIPLQAIIRQKDTAAQEVKMIAKRINFTFQEIDCRSTVTPMKDTKIIFGIIDITLDIPGDMSK